MDSGAAVAAVARDGRADDTLSRDRRRFTTRALALQEAEELRQELDRDGWTLVSGSRDDRKRPHTDLPTTATLAKLRTGSERWNLWKILWNEEQDDQG